MCKYELYICQLFVKDILCLMDEVVTCYVWFLVALPAAVAPDNQDSLCELCILCASKIATARIQNKIKGKS